MNVTTELVYDGTKAIADKMGVTVEQFKAIARANREKDPAVLARREADIVIDACDVNGNTTWHSLYLNKPLSFFPELKAGRSCKISRTSERFVSVTDRIMDKLWQKYNIATDF